MQPLNRLVYASLFPLMITADVAVAGFLGTFNPVPEPSIFALMGAGVGALLGIRHIQKKRHK